MKKIFFLFILFLSYSLTLNMEIVDKQIMIDYMKQAKQAEKNKNPQEAFQWYGKAADINLPPSPNCKKISLKKDPYSIQRRCKELAFNKLAQKACDLNKQGKFEEALATYQCAPQSFSNKITALQMLLNYQKNQK